MRLERTLDSIEILKIKPQITVEDALKFIYTFCEDLKSESGVSMEQMEAGNLEEVVKKVRWLGRTAIRTYDKKKDQILAASSRERMEKLRLELEKAEEEEAQSLQILDTLFQQERKLKKILEALQEKRKEEKKKESECREMEQKIAQYEQMDIPKLQALYLQLQEHLEKSTAKLIHWKTQCEEVSESCQKQKNQAHLLEKESTKLEQEIAVLKADNAKTEKRRKFQNEELAQLKEKQNQLEGENKRLQEEIERMEYYLSKTDVEELREIVKEKEMETEKARGDYEQIQQKMQEKEQELQKLAKVREEQKKQLQDQAWRAEEEERKAKEEREQLIRRRQDAEQQQRDFLKDKVETEKELKLLISWFESMEAEQYREELENTKKRCEILEAARNQMTEDLAYDIDTQDGSAIQMQQYFRDELRQIRERLAWYQKKYMTAIDGMRYCGILKS